MMIMLNELDEWSMRHKYILLPLFFFILFVLVVCLVVVLVGGFSSTESGTFYNQLEVLA